MANTREILRAQAEWVLWNGRKVVYRSRLEELQSKYILEQDDVNRMQVGLSAFLSKRKRGYEEKLEKEMEEMTTAKDAMERVGGLLELAATKLPDLEMQVKEYAQDLEEMDGTLLSGDDKDLYQWSKETEKCVRVVKEINFCIAKLKEMQDDFGALQEESTPLLQLQKRIDLVWLNARTFVEELETERKYDLSFLAEEDSSFMQLAKTYRCGLTRNITAVDAIADLVRTNNSLHGLDMELQELRKQLVEVFDTMAETGEGLLKKAGTETGEIPVKTEKWMQQQKEMNEVEMILALCDTCIEMGQEEQNKVSAGKAVKVEQLVFQKKMDEVYQRAVEYFKSIGKVRELPGVRMKTMRGMNRVTINGGKTIMLFRPGHPTKEMDVHRYALEGKTGFLAEADMIKWMLIDLQALREVLQELSEEAPVEEWKTETIYIEETPTEKTTFEGIGLFEEVDLTKEKERVLFGLDLLRKEFLRLTEQAEAGDSMQHWLHRPEKKENELLDGISGWEKALREWQNDLKLYRKDAGNFSCALDGYTILEMKIWQYGEDDGAELQKAYREHLQKTTEMLAETERQIRGFEK